MGRSEVAARLKMRLAKLARAGLVRIGSGRLPRGFWRLPRPGATRGAGVKAIIDERRGAR
jgi:hypothetical protein